MPATQTRPEPSSTGEFFFDDVVVIVDDGGVSVDGGSCYVLLLRCPRQERFTSGAILMLSKVC